MMKILLIRYLEKKDINTRLPESINRAKGIFPPLGIAYIASYLEKNGFDVKILDAEALNLTSNESRSIILKEKADIAGITCMTSNFPAALEAARFAKESGAIVVLGGPQINAYPKESIDYPFVDYGVYGEGEEPMLKLAQAVKEKNLNKIKKIKGIVYKKNRKGNIHVNEPFLFKNLDELPFPAWHLLPMEKYYCVITETPFITMMTARGCPYNCGFCFKQPCDKIYRMRSPKNIVDEIEYCIKKYKIKEVMFYDDTLTVNKEHIVGMCEELIKRKIKIRWEGPTRVNVIDEPLLRLMRKAGCIRLRYGVESGDENVIKIMKKGLNLDLVEKIFRLTEKNNIETFAYFIIGYYSETPETIRKTMDFSCKLNPDWAMFTVATPLPKTNLFDLASKDGLIDKEYWLKVTKSQDVGRIPFLVKDADKWAKKAYMKFYFRFAFIWKKIRKINSLEVLKNYIRGARAIVNMG